nr:hypothetical protein [Tanacetum cinerariifolium]
MDLSGYEVPRVLVTCRKEFFLVTGLRFAVENLANYNDGELPIPFRRRVFPSSSYGVHITSNMVLRIVEDELFDRLHDDDVVSLCCLGILQLVLLGVEGKRRIPDLMLRLANDRGNMPAVRLTPDETEARSDWQMLAHSATPFWQPAIPSHPGTCNWQSSIPSHDATGLYDQNILNQGKREHHPRIYKWGPYREQPHSIVLPKKRGNKTKNNVKKSNLSPLNLGNALDDDNEGGDDVMFLGAQFTGNHLVYENVDVSKGYLVPVTFWQQLVPHLCMPDIDSNTPVGWLSGEYMNSWMELLIRNRPKNAMWTVVYTNTISVHLENQHFLIETDQHAIGTLDGSTRPYPT